MRYSSTRNNEDVVSASQAILKGVSEDGGLYVPEEIPALERSLEELSRMDYREVAYEVMKLYFTDFTEDELKGCIKAAYDEKFSKAEVAPVFRVGESFYLELFHGATAAFKDMALSILPHLMIVSAGKNQVEEEIVILTATSGDTGKAALSGFAGVDGTRIVVFYPKNGVSPIQEKQMVTQKGENTCVVGIHGNFDDAQTGVKKIFGDRELAAAMKAQGFRFSSANSINIGRLIPQVVYYVYAYVQLMAAGEIEAGELINAVVPTGNFGNILAAFYARQMGLPLDRLICASNENKVLYDFFGSGTYDRKREFVLTSSPSMDILISSNLERLIYEITGKDAAQNKAFMESLQDTGAYQITAGMREQLKDFYGDFATEAETRETIGRVFQQAGYVIDTHTAVAACVDAKYREQTGDSKKSVIVATASPFKFVKSVMTALEPGAGETAGEDDFQLIERLAGLARVPVPSAIEEIRTAPVVHSRVCEVAEMKQSVLDFLGI